MAHRPDFEKATLFGEVTKNADTCLFVFFLLINSLSFGI